MNHLRRQALIRAVGGLSLAVLGGCGFALRRPATLTVTSIELRGFALRSSMADELTQAIQAGGSTSVLTSGAQVVLVALADERDTSAAASTVAGQVRELRLRRRLRFRVLDAQGREWIAPTELEQVREQSYNETDALAKQHEADGLFAAMQTDIVRQVVRRLAALRP